MRHFCRLLITAFVTVLLLFVAKLSFGQLIINNTGSNSVLQREPNRQVTGIFIIPVYADTTAPLAKIDSLGMIIQIRTTGKVYKRDTANPGHKWTEIGSGGGGSTDTTSLSARINLKVDSVTIHADTAYYWQNGVRHFAFKSTISQATLITVLGYAPLAITDTSTLISSRFFRQKGLDSIAVVFNTALSLKQNQLNGNGYIKQSSTTSSYQTPTQVTADLDVFTPSLKGLAPSSGGGTTNYLRADGTWAAPSGGGGGSQTLPQVLATGRTLAKDSIILTDTFTIKTGLIKSDSQWIRRQVKNGDTIRAFEYNEVWSIGNSVDAGRYQATNLPYGYLLQVAQRRGALATNISIGGTTLCKRSTGDSSIQERFNRIPTYRAGLRYIIGLNGLNDAFYAMDTARYRRVTDSLFNQLITTAGAPASKIFIIAGTLTDTTVYTYNVRQYADIVRQECIAFGIPYLYGIDYLKQHGGLSNLGADGFHLIQTGHNQLAIGVEGAIDSTNFIAGNNIVAQMALSVNGPIYNNGSNFITGSQRITGNDSITGTIGFDTLTSSAVAMWDLRIKGGQKFDSTWFNLYNSQDVNNKMFGMGMKNFGGFFNVLNYVPDVGAKGFMWGIRSTTTSAFTPHVFMSSNGGLGLDDTLTVLGNTSLFDTKIQGGTTIDAQKWNLYNSTKSAGAGNKWGFGLASHAGLYSIDAYSATTGGGGFRWGILGTDGVTYTPHAFLTQGGALAIDDSLGVRGVTRLTNTTTITGRLTVTNPSAVFADQMIGLYDVTVNHFGLGMGLIDGTNYMTKIYGQSAGNSGVALGIIKSDGTTYQPFLMVGSTIRVPSAQLPTGTTGATDSVMMVKSGGASAVDTLTKVPISALAPATNLGGTPGALNYPLTSSTGTGYNLVTATTNTVGVIDTAHYRTLDSLKNRTITGLNGGSSQPFSTSTAILKDGTDVTKLASFNISGFTTGTTRTITVPNANITLARIDAGQTFVGTNTFPAPIFTGLTTAPASIKLAAIDTVTGQLYWVSATTPTGNIGDGWPLTFTRNDSLLTKTIKFINGGGVSSQSDSGIVLDVSAAGYYSSDGTLTTNRTVNMGGKSLSYAATGNITFQPFGQINFSPTALYFNGATSFGSTSVLTSGTTATLSNSTTVTKLNPASLIAAFTFTMPPSPIDGQIVKIGFGGTITSGNVVVTSLTISPNSGQTMVQVTAPTTGISGKTFIYRYDLANTSWNSEN